MTPEHVIQVAKKMRHTYELFASPDYRMVPGRETCPQHLCWMLHRIECGKVTGSRAHHWLGWVQGVLVMQGRCSADYFKRLNGKNLRKRKRTLRKRKRLSDYR